MHLLDPVRVALEKGTPEEIEMLIGEYEREAGLARSTWSITSYPEWENLCLFWRGKLNTDLESLKTVTLDPYAIGKLQGRIEVLDLMLRTKEALENDGKQTVKAVDLLRRGLEIAQNRASSGGDPDINRLLAEETAARRQNLNGDRNG